MSALSIPELPADVSTLDAALLYADSGWYVGPAKRGTKDPGSLFRKGWQLKTLRDPKLIVMEFAGTDHDLFLHVGRSGAVVFDIDNPARLPAVLEQAERECEPPLQRTRPDRRHLIFAQPPGRDIGNSAGQLGGDWGEVRGRNGVIMVYPSSHSSGGEYQWLTTGPVPVLPSYVADLVPDQGATEDAADDEQVRTFLASHVDETQPELLDRLLGTVKDMLETNARHTLFPGWTATAMKEAACGYYPARGAADTLEAIFHDAEGKGPGRVRSRVEADNEWAAILAWAVGQATPSALDRTRERVAERKEPLILDDDETSDMSASTATADSSTNGSEPPAGTGRTATREASLSTKMRRHVEARFDVFEGDDGHCYAIPLSGDVRLAERVSSGFVIRACRSLGHSSKAAKECAEMLIAFAPTRRRRTLSLRSVRTSDGVVLDLAQERNSRCVVVTAHGWELRDRPPDGVIFRRSQVTRPLPDPVQGGSLDPLRRVLGFAAHDRRWLLINGWLPAVLLADLPRPLLAFVGVQGSAKTTRAAMVSSVVDPKPREGLGSSFGRSSRDDEVKALAHYLPAWDNISSLSQQGSDFLARLVTGTSSDARALYSDDRLSVITYRRSGVLTGITLPSNLGSDVLERLILIRCDRVSDDERRSESSLWKTWDSVHPTVLGGVLDQLVTLLARLADVKAQSGSRPRMADYFDAQQALGADFALAYWQACTDVMIESAQADLFVNVT